MQNLRVKKDGCRRGHCAFDVSDLVPWKRDLMIRANET